MEQQLHFHTSVCEKHKIEFVAICLEHGIRDRWRMEHLRMRFIVEAMHQFTDAEFVDFIRSTCIACEHEEWSEAVARRLAQEENEIYA